LAASIHSHLHQTVQAEQLMLRHPLHLSQLQGFLHQRHCKGSQIAYRATAPVPSAALAAVAAPPPTKIRQKAEHRLCQESSRCFSWPMTDKVGGKRMVSFSWQKIWAVKN